MFKNNFTSLDSLFSEGHKLATKSILFFGFFLVMSAVLFFMFPAIIGTLFAIFIFLTGFFILIVGYYFRQAKTEKSYNLDPFYIEFDYPQSRYNRPRYYNFHKIRFVRW